MPLVADRVQETTTTTGTGTVTLAGAVTGYQAFTTAFSTGAVVYYCITDGTSWEVGVGTFTTAGTTLSRTTVLSSSNAGSLVAFASGSKNVFNSWPAAFGGVANNATAIALGRSYASGDDSFAAAIANITSSYGAQGVNSIAAGYQAKASASGGISLGSYNIAAGTGSFVAGSNCSALSSYGFVIGNQSQSVALSSVALGSYAVSSYIGKYAYSGDYTTSVGDTQTGIMILSKTATVASTDYILTSDHFAAGAANQVIVPVSSCFTFDGVVVARQQAAGGTNADGWTVSGVARREATGNIAFIGTPTVTPLSTVPTGWVLTCVADTTNQAIQFVFNMGATTMNVRCLATIRTAELKYA